MALETNVLQSCVRYTLCSLLGMNALIASDEQVDFQRRTPVWHLIQTRLALETNAFGARDEYVENVHSLNIASDLRCT